MRPKQLLVLVLAAVGSLLVAIVGTWMLLGTSLMRVEGVSMAPTLSPGSYLLVRRTMGAPSRGDIVVYREAAPSLQREVNLIHRVVAIDGDTVEVRDGHLFINGAEQSEHYAAERIRYELPPPRIADDQERWRRGYWATTRSPDGNGSVSGPGTGSYRGRSPKLIM